MSDLYDLWVVKKTTDAGVVTKAEIQFGNLVPDSSTPGRYTLTLDSQVIGQSFTAIESIETVFPNKIISLGDTTIWCIDTEHTGAFSIEDPPGQHRLGNMAPGGTSPDWTEVLAQLP